MALAKPQAECLSETVLREFLDGSRTTVASREVEDHIETCTSCEQSLKRLLDEYQPLLTTRITLGEQPESSETVPTIQRYQCLELIDKGGFGLVWKMMDLHFNRLVAVKVMKMRDSAHGELKRRFFAEAQICSQLSHPNIVPVHDMGELPDGRGYYAMKLVKGERLDAECAATDASLLQRLQIFENICHAVAFAHEKGVVHRDLKPGNIMVGQHGEVQVMDWGLAKVTDSDAGLSPNSNAADASVRETSRQDSDQTSRGAIGTLAYMAPEQAFDGSEATTRSDVYSLGVILFEMLSSERFRDVAAVDQMEDKIANGVVDESKLRCLKNVDDRLRDIVKSCVQPAPSQRPGDAAEVLERITKFRRTIEQEANDQKIENERQRTVLAESKKKRRLWIALAAVLSLGLIGTGVAAYQANVARRDADVARQQAVDSAMENERLADNRNDVIDFLTTNVFGKADPGQEPDRQIGFREVLDLATADARSMELDPEVKSKILIELGKVYFNLDEFTVSLDLFSQAEQITSQSLDRIHPLHMTALDQKGMVLLYMENFEEAEGVLKQALELQKKVLGPDHEDTIHSLAKLGDLYSNWGKQDKAIPITKEVLSRRTKIFGPKYRFTLVSMNGLALLYDQVGRDEEAVALLREAYRIAIEVEGPENIFTLTYANNLALALIDVDKLDEAEKAAEDVLSIRRRLLGEDHSSVFATRHTLARVWFGQFRYGECLAECESMLTDFPAESVRRSVVIFLKAKCHGQLDQSSEARKFAKQSRAALIQQLGEDNRFQAEIDAFLQELDEPVRAASSDTSK
jgi:serine/threonine protein kinase